MHPSSSGSVRRSSGASAGTSSTRPSADYLTRQSQTTLKRPPPLSGDEPQSSYRAGAVPITKRLETASTKSTARDSQIGEGSTRSGVMTPGGRGLGSAYVSAYTTGSSSSSTGAPQSDRFHKTTTAGAPTSPPTKAVKRSFVGVLPRDSRRDEDLYALSPDSAPALDISPTIQERKTPKFSSRAPPALQQLWRNFRSHSGRRRTENSTRPKEPKISYPLSTRVDSKGRQVYTLDPPADCVSVKEGKEPVRSVKSASKTPVERPPIPEPEADEELPDIQSDRFVLLKYIGAGGEGAVYEAYDKLRDQRVAIKLSNRKDNAKGFHKEHQINARCNRKSSLGIVPRLLDSRVYPEGQGGTAPEYLVMELMGPSIRSLLQSVANYRQQNKSSNRGMDIASTYTVARKLIRGIEEIQNMDILHHDIKPQNVVLRNRHRSLTTDKITDEDDLCIIDFGMSYFKTHGQLHPKRHCRFCGSMDYSSRASRYRCQPSMRDDLESLGYLLLWLVMGNRAYKAWRSAVLEPYWEMISVLWTVDDSVKDICEILGSPSQNDSLYDIVLRNRATPKVFISRSAVQAKTNDKPPEKKDPFSAHKKCDPTLFSTAPNGRPDDLVEGNLPMLNRSRIPKKVLIFILYCQSLGFAETPAYSKLIELFSSANDDIPSYFTQRLNRSVMRRNGSSPGSIPSAAAHYSSKKSYATPSTGNPDVRVVVNSRGHDERGA